MALQSVLQDGASKEAVLSALRVAQMVWTLNQQFGTVDGSAHTEPFPSLSEGQVDKIAAQADKLLRHIIAGERTALTSAEAMAQTSNVAHFTKQKKRGAKVRTGPCAAILTFPACSAPGRLTGENLLSEWAWIKRNHSGWDDEELSGSCGKEEWRKLFIEKATGAAIDGKPMPDGDAIRKEIAKHRATIEKRVHMKDWLETRGVNWDEVNSPEQALSFIFDRLHASEQPVSA